MSLPCPTLTSVSLVSPFGGSLWHRVSARCGKEFYIVQSCFQFLGVVPQTCSKKVYLLVSAQLLQEQLFLEEWLNRLIREGEQDLYRIELEAAAARQTEELLWSQELLEQLDQLDQ